MSDKPDFAELKRKRDEAVRRVVEAFAKEHGLDASSLTVHVSGHGDCYCACPDGPCEHQWDGENYISDDRCLVSSTCSKCGAICAYHDMRCGP